MIKVIKVRTKLNLGAMCPLWCKTRSRWQKSPTWEGTVIEKKPKQFWSQWTQEINLGTHQHLSKRITPNVPSSLRILISIMLVLPNLTPPLWSQSPACNVGSWFRFLQLGSKELPLVFVSEPLKTKPCYHSKDTMTLTLGAWHNFYSLLVNGLSFRSLLLSCMDETRNLLTS